MLLTPVSTNFDHNSNVKVMVIFEFELHCAVATNRLWSVGTLPHSGTQIRLPLQYEYQIYASPPSSSLAFVFAKSLNNAAGVRTRSR